VSDRATIYAFRRDLVLAASAGTGKTHGLVGVLVHLLLGASELGGAPHAPVDPARVVATTFSRKAAAEIRARLVEELEKLATNDPNAKYRADLDAARDRVGDRWSDAEIAKRARAASSSIARAQIGTLHGFASSLLRTYALEHGLSPSFELADEETTRARAEDAIARAIDRIGRTRGAELAALVTAANGVERLASQITRALARLEEEGRGAASLAVNESDAAAIEAQMQRTLDHARALARLPRFGEPASALLSAWETKDPDAIADAAESFASVRSGKDGPEAEAWFAFREAFLPGKTNGERGRSLAVRWRLRDHFAASSRFARDVLAACEEEARRDAAHTSVLAYGDLLRMTRDLLRDRPDLAAEIGASLDVLLVDEFQDTSRLQRDLLVLLWQRDPRSRAPGMVPSIGDVRRHGLLVVGDRKQSIYAFRGADVSVFAEVCVGLAGAHARVSLGIEAGRTWEPEEPIADFVPLRHNRRGEPELLAFANEFSARRFRPGDPPELYEIAYVPRTEDLLSPPERAAPTDPVPRTTWLRIDPQKQGKRVSSASDEASVIAHHVRAIVASGEPRVNGEAPRWRDIAVLAETNRALDHVAYALARAEVPYVVAGSGFYNAREVRDVAAMLALLIDTSAQWAIVEVLRGPWCGARDETLIALTNDHAGIAEVGPAWGAGERRDAIHADDRAAIAEVRRVVTTLHGDLDRLGPGGALREAVRALELEEVLVRLPRGAQRVANVHKLLAIADTTRDPRALLDSLDEAAEREISEGEAATFSEEDDAIRLLTVHASKGLDFPIVLIPEVGKEPRRVEREAFRVASGEGDAGMIVARVVDPEGRVHDAPSYERAMDDARRRDRAERQRLAYVATTRASHAMRLVGDRVAPQKGESETYAATTAATLHAIADDAASRARAFLVVEDVDPSAIRVDAPARPPATHVEPSSSAWVPVTSPAWRSLPIAATALQDFHHCARRFELAHVLDLPEHAPPFVEAVTRDAIDDANAGPRLDARAEGTLAHRVLERVDAASFGATLFARAEASRILEREGIPRDHEKHERVVDRVLRFLGGAYAERVAAMKAQIAREVPFVIDVRDASDRAIALRGSIDLLVRWKDGTVDVVDYKRARGPSPEPHAFQLDAYALAARAMVPNAAKIRAGIVFLGGGRGDPAWIAPFDPVAARARLAPLGARLVEARWGERFPREPITTCRAIRCGYVQHCHPDEPR
jgi:ATP-dependent helicase/nuclease subunit A